MVSARSYQNKSPECSKFAFIKTSPAGSPISNRIIDRTNAVHTVVLWQKHSIQRERALPFAELIALLTTRMLCPEATGTGCDKKDIRLGIRRNESAPPEWPERTAVRSSRSRHFAGLSDRTTGMVTPTEFVDTVSMSFLGFRRLLRRRFASVR